MNRFLRIINRNYPLVIRGLNQLTYMAVSIFIGLALVGLLYFLWNMASVEFHRVYEAIKVTIIPDERTASSAAFGVVFGLVLIPIVEKREQYLRGTFKFYHDDSRIARRLSLKNLVYNIRFYLGLHGAYEGRWFSWGELDEEYMTKNPVSPTFGLSVLKWGFVLLAGLLSAIASLDPVFIEYEGVPVSEAIVLLQQNADFSLLRDVFVNFIFTTSIAFGEVITASFAAGIAVVALQEIEKIGEKARKTQSVIDGIFYVGDLTDANAGTLSAIKEFEGVLPEDKVDVTNNNFFDSLTQNWIKEKGYSNVTSFKTRVKRILLKRE